MSDIPTKCPDCGAWSCYERELATLRTEKEKWRTLAIDRKKYLRAANKGAKIQSLVGQLATGRLVKKVAENDELRKLLAVEREAADRLSEQIDRLRLAVIRQVQRRRFMTLTIQDKPASGVLRNALVADGENRDAKNGVGGERAETSEQRHGISAQPEDTCPLIDKARACVEKCQRTIRNYECADEEELRDMISTVESELSDIIGWRSGLLEDIRIRVTEVRAWGQEWKEAAKDYWSTIPAEEGGEETHRTDEGKRPTLNIMPIQQRAARVLQQIGEQLALAENATPGPWQHDQAMSPGYIEHFVGVDGAATAIASDVLDDGGQPSMANATFIAASRSGWPVALRCLKTVIEGLLPEAIPYSWRAEMLTTICDQWETN